MSARAVCVWEQQERVTVREVVNSRVKTLSGANPVYLRVWLGVSGVVALMSTKKRELVFCSNYCFWLQRRETFGRWGLKDAHERSSSQKKSQNLLTCSEQRGIVSIVSAARRLVGATFLLCGFATGCDKTHRHGCAQQSMGDATFLLCWIANGAC